MTDKAPETERIVLHRHVVPGGIDYWCDALCVRRSSDPLLLEVVPAAAYDALKSDLAAARERIAALRAALYKCLVTSGTDTGNTEDWYSDEQLCRDAVDGVVELWKEWVRP